MAATAIVDALWSAMPGMADLRFEAWKFASVLLREAAIAVDPARDRYPLINPG